MSAAPSSFATSLDRRIQMLRTAMGPLIAAALEDPDVVEVMLNPCLLYTSPSPRD